MPKTKSSTIKIKCALYAMPCILMSTVAISTILAEIQRNFPDVSTTYIQMLSTVPSITGMIFAFVAGKLTEYVSKKNIAMGALLLFAACGVIPYFFHGVFWVLMLTSLLLGISQGMITTVAKALVADMFEEGPERDRAVGQQIAFQNLASLLMAQLAGRVAATGWYNAYLLFTLSIPAFILVFLFLPNGKPTPKETKGIGGGALKSTVIFICIAGFLFQAFQGSYKANLAMYLDAYGLGGTVSTGNAFTIYAAASILASFLYGRIAGIFKRHSICVSLGSVIIGFLCVCSYPSYALACVAAFFIGFGLAIFISSGMSLAFSNVPPSATAMAMAMFNGIAGLGGTFSPAILNTMTNAVGGDVRTRLIIATVCLIILFIGCFIRVHFFEKDPTVIKGKK